MILCIGTTPTAQRSLSFDRVRIDQVNRAKEVSDYASGKSINVARVLQTLGYRPVCTGFLGGARGEMIREDLSGGGIAHDFVETSSPTRLCTTVIDRSTNTATELVEESAEVPGGAWEGLTEKVGVLAGDARVAVLSGSLPPKAPQDAYARWTRVLGCPIVLDTRGEPAVRVLSEKGLGRLYLKMNAFELAETIHEVGLSGVEDLKRAMRKLVPGAGVCLVITLGKDGALATEDGDSFVRVRTPPISPVSAIGSGDAFAAGLAAGVADSLPFVEALKLGAACGTANALTSRAGHLNRGDVDHILAGTIVSRA
jgi:tagatose 6-phosphate kinase